jgi:hypothetical protein
VTKTVNLEIKNVPEAIVEQLLRRACQNNRSLEGEILAILEESVGYRRLSQTEVDARIKSFGLSTPSESTDIIRMDRDAR